MTDQMAIDDSDVTTADLQTLTAILDTADITTPRDSDTPYNRMLRSYIASMAGVKKPINEIIQLCREELDQDIADGIVEVSL